ncbi:molybdopterin-dependent oxidoreductase [Frondihabitans australicus]|uniref:DMSO/TMAO reductase YedYZ molybdopterin-dependent catalytic subunit n=1 Tax=Frondihabitans australicus TaxID=386892 RepID=A0A495IJZ3_9MICO|nr:molybdopterin-dependent oxidoreductase [Frondihabitans australicus]RKR76332.1 DMSO/TMAO reductase YedYZ molybdopterin-dependent catalytic subunit [Frondihabitans australicus]
MAGFEGFASRRQTDPALPPGQHLERGFPVLSAGPDPNIKVWELQVATETGQRSWSWDDFLALPQEDITTDIHCVTSWSKLGTHWRGVSVDTLFDGLKTEQRFAMARSYGGYTTNLPLEDLLGGKAWVMHTFEGRPLASEHGGPARLFVPHLYFWKSAKWLQGIQTMAVDRPGFWENYGYHNHGDPWKEERYA